MSDYERRVLDHYGLTTSYPTEWPADKDLSDASDYEDYGESSLPPPNSVIQRSKSRYSALARAASYRKSLVPGSQKTGDGVENLVQKDEPDPLGTSESVVRVLRHQGLPVQEDTELRNRFLLSSTTFSPPAFLSQVHSNASAETLEHGLDVLTRSIDQKSASLKVLVESNFERFVRAKSTIDNVYTEMKNRGTDPQQSRPRTHSRHTSKNSFRGSNGGISSPLISTSPIGSKKKNALAKESEYGVLGIKTPLIDVSAKAEEVYGPALGGKERVENLKMVASLMDQHRDIFDAPSNIADCIKRKDHESLVEEYIKAKGYADEAKRIADEALASKTRVSAPQTRQIYITGRMWYDVLEQIEEFKRDVWRRLAALQNNTLKSNTGEYQDQHMELIGILLELGVEDNPIWVWLLSRYDHLKNKIQASSDRSRVEIEVLRRRLANGPKSTPLMISSHLQSLDRHGLKDKPTGSDSADVIELWERILTYLNGMLSSQGILGEVLEFWQMAQDFIDGKTQKSLPLGINGQSRSHHRLSAEGSTDLQKGTVELIDMIRECLFSFFTDPPIEDISLIFSPIPLSPNSPRSGTLTPSARDPRFAFDANNIPPPSPRLGEAWEKFAFWPPWSNSLSGINYLSKMLNLVGTGASEMAAVSVVGRGDGTALDRLRALVAGARERCVTAICAAWNRDAENIKVLEDWRRSAGNRDLTRIPASFSSFESTILSGMQKILYISEATTKSGPGDVVTPPPAKLLQMVRSQFVTTLYKALSGMVENAEKSVKKVDDDWAMETGPVASPATMIAAVSIGAGTVDASDRNVRMLLTLSNLQALRGEVVPKLISQFENAFSVKLTEETKTIRDVLGQIDSRLFASYTRPSIESLHGIIQKGVLADDWVPLEKPKEVRPYVYEALLNIVLIHTQVITTASSLASQVLSYLLEQTSRELLEAFKQRSNYTLAALMQATLDVEFVAQTLSQYTTDRASETQSQIYQELDKRTDNDARTRLQSELPEMRAVLKRLREASRSEFACFKKDRRAKPPS